MLGLYALSNEVEDQSYQVKGSARELITTMSQGVDCHRVSSINPVQSTKIGMVQE